MITKLGQTLDTIKQQEWADAAKNADAAKAGYESSRTQSIVLLALGSLLALGLGVIVARMIVRSLSKVKEVCSGLARGDLTRTSGLTSHDEPGQMGRALDTAISQLHQTVTTIDGSASSLAAASEQMSGTAQQIAVSAEETSAQAQTVSAAAEQISRSVDTVCRRQRGDGRLHPGDLAERHRGRHRHERDRPEHHGGRRGGPAHQRRRRRDPAGTNDPARMSNELTAVVAGFGY